MKKIIAIIILLIFVLARVKFDKIDLEKLKNKEIIIQIKDKENRFIKIKNGSSIADVIYEYNLNLKNDEYDFNYILNENDIINLNKENKSINRVTLKELEEIPFITKNNAEKIIEYRRNNGFFKNFDQLEEIEGIGKSKIKLLRKFLTI